MAVPTSAHLYIDLLKGCLTRELFLDEEVRNVDLRRWPDGGREAILPVLKQNGWRLVQPGADRSIRDVGHDWPPAAETMIGTQRLDNVHECVVQVIKNGVPGDFIETGVWRGGSTILMRGILAAFGDTDRTVWVADSFEGLPPSDVERYPADEGIALSGIKALEVSVDQVKANFARYDLLDEQVRFLVGWFEDTLPIAPVEQLAILRLDGDLYQSTMDALTALYPKLSVGGYVIVDDYGGIEACRQAVTDYRAANGITDVIHEIDWTGVYWQRSAEHGGTGLEHDRMERKRLERER